MARVPTDTSSLRGMRQGTRVTARPVDTYTSVGNQVQRNSKTQQIANALAQVEPKLTTFFDNRQQEFQADQKAEGLKSYLEASSEERRSYAKKIKSGEIDEIESPFFIEGVSRGVLRDKARDFGNNIVKEWNSRKDSAGLDINKFIAEYQQEFIKEHGLQAFDADVFNQEFGQRAEAFGNIVNQRAYEHSLKKAREYQLASLGKDTIAARNESFNQDTGEFDGTGYVKKINEVVNDYIAQGLDPSKAIEEAKNNLHAMALDDIENKDVYIDAMRGIQTRVGTYGETGSGALFTTRLDQQLDEKMEREEDEAYADAVKEQQRELDVLSETALTQLVQEGPEWFDSQEGKDLLDAVLVNPQGGMSSYNAIRTQIENRDKIITDPAIKAAYQDQILRGEDVSTAILNDPDLSPSDKVALRAAASTAGRLGNITNSLGVNHVETFVGQAVRRDTNQLANVFGATKYDALKPEATLIANDIVLQAAGKFDLTTTQGRNEANTWIMGELDKMKPTMEARREEVATEQGKLSALGKTAQESLAIDELPADPATKNALKLLPSDFSSNPNIVSRELRRPPSSVVEPTLDATDASEVEAVEYKQDLEKLVEEFNRIAVDPLRSWEQSEIFNMAARRGVGVEVILSEIDGRIATAPVKTPEVILPFGATVEEMEAAPSLGEQFESLKNLFVPEQTQAEKLRERLDEQAESLRLRTEQFRQGLGLDEGVTEELATEIEEYLEGLK